MTDRIQTITIALDKDYREDDLQPLMDALKQFKGVIAVEGNVTDHNDWGNREMIRRELGEKLWEVLYPKR